MNFLLLVRRTRVNEKTICSCSDSKLKFRATHFLGNFLRIGTQSNLSLLVEDYYMPKIARSEETSSHWLLAQLAERRAVNSDVVGSRPT